MKPGARFGAELTPQGVTFRLWAPEARSVDLVLDRPQPMRRHEEGWYELDVRGIGAGALYKYRINGELEVPDPASHFQPEDVSGPSEVIDHDAYAWQTAFWRGRPWHEAVFLELHVGTFATAGTYRGVIDKLDHFVEAGITAIELMPLADFAGARNWGYDGVLLFAPDSSYGRPDDLRRLIDAAHARGLMVFLDVVYNHFGPEGNYLSRYAPQFFTAAQTPWGSAIDYRNPTVRAFVIENALHWLGRYRFDGLRLDAVHAITEPGEPSILTDLSRVVGGLAAASGRQIHLVLENDDNRTSLLDPRTDPPRGQFRAQWNDDYHHAWHVLLAGETGGYYGDYAREPTARIARILASGFDYQGEASSHRGGRRRGEPSGALSPIAFVNFLQNHDQIGNRALGERLEVLARPAAIEAALAVTLIAPMPPLLFMGEEWGSTQPFPFFCDFKGDLAEAVRQGRREEFKAAYARYGNDIPDPLSAATFQSAVLDWEALASVAGSRRLSLVRELLTVRTKEILPYLPGVVFGHAQVDGAVLTSTWLFSGGRRLMLLANLSSETAARPAGFAPHRVIWAAQAGGDEILPWTVVWGVGAS
jgi:malto-oligosyltrehalose trehalohydrolase